jgi:hypothetical protein
LGKSIGKIKLGKSSGKIKWKSITRSIYRNTCSMRENPPNGKALIVQTYLNPNHTNT